MSVRTLGRNDPCPCGSGKKYKKCCIGNTFQPAPMSTYHTSPSSQPRAVATSKKPVDASQAAADGIPEYVFVKNKGWTHRNELRPGDECKFKDGDWGIYRPDLMNGGSVYVKDKGWIPESDLKPGDQYEHDGVWVTFQPERVIGTTEEHPFFVKDKGWTPAGQLKEGDLLRTVDGWVPVTGIKNTGRYETVYNLRVADYHTYFVGTPEWGFAVWAHNACYVTQLGKDGKWYIHEVIDGKAAAEPLQGLSFADKAAADLHVTKQGAAGVMEKVPGMGDTTGLPHTDFLIEGGMGDGFAARLNHTGETLSLDWQGGVGNLKPRLGQINELAGKDAVAKIQKIEGYASDNLLKQVEAGNFDTARWNKTMQDTFGGTWETKLTKEGGKWWIRSTRVP